MISLSLKTRRFIIVWIIIQVFALVVNYAGLDWKFEFESRSPGTHGRETDWTVFLIYPLTRCEGNQKNAESQYSFDNNRSQFWPFVTFYKESEMDYAAYTYSINKKFNGLFYKYDFVEFLIYCLLPFAIIIIRRLWK